MDKHFVNTMEGLREMRCSISLADKLGQNVNLETDIVKAVHAWPEGNIRKMLESSFRLRLDEFLEVRQRLLSQVVAWDALIEDRKHFDSQPYSGQNLPSGLIPRQYALLFVALQSRSKLGITTVEPAIKVKRSIENDDEERSAKKVKATEAKDDESHREAGKEEASNKSAEKDKVDAAKPE